MVSKEERKLGYGLECIYGRSSEPAQSISDCGEEDGVTID